jgi:pimeloyl-ACP methyl ester carboxylesterase
MRRSLRAVEFLLLLVLAACCIFYWDPLWVNDQFTRLHLWRSRVHSKYVEAGGHRLHYYEAAPPDGSPGIPIVLVHGLGGRAEDWSPMIPTLAAAGFHVYALDLLGYGRSEKPEAAYSISLEEGVVVDFMRSVGLSRADLDGWSMGGWIAAKLALDHPAMVDRLVLDDSAGVTFRPSFARDAFVPTDASGLGRLMALLTPKPRTLPDFVVRGALRKVQSERKVLQESMDSMLAGGDLLDSRLSGVRQPTLLVWGTDDQLIPMTVGQTMHKDIANSVLVGIVGCGHLAPAECSKPVLAATLQFLQAQPPMQGGEVSIAGTAEAGPNPAAASQH